MNTLSPFILLFTVALAGAQQATPAWPARLLDKPFHVGDTHRKDMQNPAPDGASFVAMFDLPPTIKPGIAGIAWVTIRAAGLAPVTDKHVKPPAGRARIFVNGVEVGDLNKLAGGDGTAANIQRQQFRIPGTALRATGNKLEIRPGASPRNVLDFELHEVIVAATAQ